MDSERTAERRSPLRVVLIVIAAIPVVPFVLMAVMVPTMWMRGFDSKTPYRWTTAGSSKPTTALGRLLTASTLSTT